MPLVRKKLILAKLETTIGTNSAPTPNLNAMQVFDISAEPITNLTTKSAIIAPYFGNSSEIVTGTYSKLKFKVQLAASGTAGTKPAFNDLLEACALAGVVVANTSVAYSPITDAPKTITIIFYADGNKHILTAARGTFKLDLSVGAIPSLEFEFTGVYNATAAESNPSGTNLSAFNAPAPVFVSNEGQYQLNAVNYGFKSFTIDAGNKIDYNQWTDKDTIDLTDRNTTGSLELRDNNTNAVDLFAKAQTGTAIPLSITHGTTAGQIIQITAPKVQLTAPNYGDANGTQTLKFNTLFIPNAGNDEYTITFK